VVTVASVPFSDIDDAWLEPADVGAETLDGWRSDRRAFYATIRDEVALLLGEPGWRFTDEEPMMLLRYRAVSDDGDGTGTSVPAAAAPPND
jgi:hypothetical protein